MIAPRLFAGAAGASDLLRVGSGYTDDSAIYDLVAETNRTAPAGPGGEVVVSNLYLATRVFVRPVTLHVTIEVDDLVVGAYPLVLAGGTSDGLLQTHVIECSVPYIRDGVERFRTRPRGTWIAVKIATDFAGDGLTPANVHVYGAELEYEVVRDSFQMAATP